MRTPPQRRAVPAARASADQEIEANPASSSSRARATACRSPSGRTGNALRASESHTTVAVRRPSTSSRPTRAYTGVVNPSQRLDRCGVSNGTGINQRRSPRCRAYSCMIRPYDTTSAPPTSNTRPSPCGRSSTATRYATRSAREIGWVGVRTHDGQIMTGSRSTSARINSNERLPAPSTMPLRNSMTGTPDSRSTAPVSCRLRRCRERPAAEPRPPTYTMRRTPAVRAAAPKLRAAARSCASKSAAPPIEWTR